MIITDTYLQAVRPTDPARPPPTPIALHDHDDDHYDDVHVDDASDADDDDEDWEGDRDWMTPSELREWKAWKHWRSTNNEQDGNDWQWYEDGWRQSCKQEAHETKASKQKVGCVATKTEDDGGDTAANVENELRDEHEGCLVENEERDGEADEDKKDELGEEPDADQDGVVRTPAPWSSVKGHLANSSRPQRVPGTAWVHPQTGEKLWTCEQTGSTYAAGMGRGPKTRTRGTGSVERCREKWEARQKFGKGKNGKGWGHGGKASTKKEARVAKATVVWVPTRCQAQHVEHGEFVCTIYSKFTFMC